MTCEAEDEVWTMSGLVGGDDVPLSCAALLGHRLEWELEGAHRTPSLGCVDRIHCVLDYAHLLDVAVRFRGIPCQPVSSYRI